MIRPELKYGLIAGLGIALWFHVEYFLGLHTTHRAVGQYTSQFASLVLIVSLLRLLRQRQLAYGPAFQLPGALWSGLQTSFIAATLLYIGTTFYRQFINPDWLVNILAWNISAMRAAGTDEGTIQLYAENTKRYSTPLRLLLSTLYWWILQGALCSVLLTLWLKWRYREKAP